MTRLATPVIVCVAAVFSAAAFAYWTLVAAPFASPVQLVVAFPYLVPVLFPYVAMLGVHKRSVDTFSQWTTVIMSILAAFGALSLYWPAFFPNGGEYGVEFVIVPIAQLLLVLTAWGIATWRRRVTARSVSP